MRAVSASPILLLALVALCGCGSEPFRSSDGPTYYGDVAPLLNENCRSCHSDGNLAPIAFDSYEQVRRSAALIKQATAEGWMPPWHVNDSGDCQSFKDSRRLSAEEIALLGAWVDAGTPEGEKAELDPPPPAESLDTVSVTLDVGVDYNPRTEDKTDDYRCFLVDPHLDSDHFLVGHHAQPGEPSIVHHVVLYSIDSDAERAIAEGLDAAEPGPGYTCFGASGTGAGRSLGVWTPGTGATRYPPGTGLRLLGGQPVIMQVHYYRGGKPDRTRVDLELAEQVDREAFLTGTLDLSLELPPGMESIAHSAALPIPLLERPLLIYGAFPHMHNYGRSIQVHVDRGGGSSECLVDVPSYDFDWQRFYFYNEPVQVDPPGGGYFRINCSYDTRGATSTIYWGEGTDDEMCIAALYATY